MKLMTRDTDYAIRAMCFIAQKKDKIISVSELFKKTGIPRPFLRKILQILNNKGLLKSYKGKGGGFQLNNISREISLLDLIEAFQGPFELNKHIFKNKLCMHVKKCKLKKKIDNIEKKVKEELRKITLASLI